jgi:hypothetical protein
MPLGNWYCIRSSDFLTFIWFSIIQGLSKTSFCFIFGDYIFVNKLLMTLVMNGVDQSVTWHRDDVLLFYNCTYMGSGILLGTCPLAVLCLEVH